MRFLAQYASLVAAVLLGPAVLPYVSVAAASSPGIPVVRISRDSPFTSLDHDVLSLVPPLTDGGNSNPIVLPPNSNPYGASYGEWGARFWQWLMQYPLSSNPLFDQTGESCGLGQSGPVWFLAGTAGSVATRSCAVPTGRSLFFPIVNYLNDYPCPDPSFQPAPGQSLEDFLAEGADFIIDHTTELEVQVDGIALQNLFNYRARSPLFTFTADASLQAFDPCVTGSAQQGVTDGYWIMLAPLSSGQHVLHFRGKQDFPEFDFSFEVDVTYNLTVEPIGRGRASIAASDPGTSLRTWGLVKELFR